MNIFAFYAQSFTVVLLRSDDIEEPKIHILNSITLTSYDELLQSLSLNQSDMRHRECTEIVSKNLLIFVLLE